MSSDSRRILQTVVYRERTAYVEVRARPGAWFGEVRVWRGERWPITERRWYGHLRSWLPWFSLEKQATKAVRYVSKRTTMAQLTAEEVHAAIERLRRELLHR